ncbi:MAG: guanitoxin biosynthesis heme-dependent pre-guanitoxin N-hydroxylase GntA [Chryseolinea sp.]
MGEVESFEIESSYRSFIDTKEFPCIAAKAALARQQISCLVVDHLACPKDDHAITRFLHAFIDTFRDASELYNSAAVIFKGPTTTTEEEFDNLFWDRLQALSDIDAARYLYDNRVGNDPEHSSFSFSIKQEAFYIIGLHPAASRLARRFDYPVIVFNPHSQFEQLREANKYEPMKKAIRNRDVTFSGTVNPMLSDFGTNSEVLQYSGRQYGNNWKCPFVSHHDANTESHSAT